MELTKWKEKQEELISKDLSKDIYNKKLNLFNNFIDFIDNNNNILLYVDHDFDGISSGILLYSFLKSINKKCIPYISSRKQGYGLFYNIMKDKYNEYKFDSIISADLGITSGKEIDLFKTEFPNINILISD